MDWKTMVSGKRLKWIVGAGLAGILLILFSTIWPKEPETVVSETDTEENAAPMAEEYRQKYEQTALQLVQKIVGAGEAQVFVTLDSGVEYVYETEENRTADTQNANEETYSEKNSLQKKTLLVEGEDGREKPILKTTLEPKIRGVVVVCEGGGDVLVMERIVSAMTTLFGISSTRVAVLQSDPMQTARS